MDIRNFKITFGRALNAQLLHTWSKRMCVRDADETVQDCGWSIKHTEETNTRSFLLISMKRHLFPLSPPPHAYMWAQVGSHFDQRPFRYYNECAVTWQRRIRQKLHERGRTTPRAPPLHERVDHASASLGCWGLHVCATAQRCANPRHLFRLTAAIINVWQWDTGTGR